MSSQLPEKATPEDKRKFDHLFQDGFAYIFLCYSTLTFLGWVLFVKMSVLPKWLSLPLFALTCIPPVGFWVYRFWFLISRMMYYRKQEKTV